MRVGTKLVRMSAELLQISIEYEIETPSLLPGSPRSDFFESSFSFVLGFLLLTLHVKQSVGQSVPFDLSLRYPEPG